MGIPFPTDGIMHTTRALSISFIQMGLLPPGMILGLLRKQQRLLGVELGLAVEVVLLK
jgi:hypothetical protein